MRVPKKRPPSHPGEILLKDFLEPMGISQRELADALHVPYQRINEIINEKRGITISTALRLSKFFGNNPQFWLNLQQNWELFYVLKEEKHEIETITSLSLNLNNHERDFNNEDVKITS
jgi:antitoxin HigA-1